MSEPRCCPDCGTLELSRHSFEECCAMLKEQRDLATQRAEAAEAMTQSLLASNKTFRENIRDAIQGNPVAAQRNPVNDAVVRDVDALRIERDALRKEAAGNRMTHISELVQEEMNHRGWDRDDLADEMCGEGDDWSATRLCVDLMMEVRDPDLSLGEVADQLARAFGTSSVLWTRLDDAWRARAATEAKWTK